MVTSSKITDFAFPQNPFPQGFNQLSPGNKWMEQWEILINGDIPLQELLNAYWLLNCSLEEERNEILGGNLEEFLRGDLRMDLEHIRFLNSQYGRVLDFQKAASGPFPNLEYSERFGGGFLLYFFVKMKYGTKLSRWYVYLAEENRPLMNQASKVWGLPRAYPSEDALKTIARAIEKMSGSVFPYEEFTAFGKPVNTNSANVRTALGEGIHYLAHKVQFENLVNHDGIWKFRTIDEVDPAGRPMTNGRFVPLTEAIRLIDGYGEYATCGMNALGIRMLAEYLKSV